MSSNIGPSIMFEHKFWLQVLGDHVRFILKSLSFFERQEIEQALVLMDQLDMLLQRARLPLQTNEIAQLNQQAFSLTTRLKDFKLHLLRRLIEEDIDLNLTPTYINHMINELKAYLLILSNGNIIKSPNINISFHYHFLWLPTLANHAEMIKSSLDLVEKKLQDKAQQFVTDFHNFYIKCIEFSGYLRSKPKYFPALVRFCIGVSHHVDSFITFQKELQTMLLSRILIANLSPLMLDHMIREESYYIHQLSLVSDVKKSEIDPTRPRISNKP